MLLSTYLLLALSDPVWGTMKKSERFVNEQEVPQSKWGDLSIAIQRILSTNIKSVSHELVVLYSNKFLRACASHGSPLSDTREESISRVIGRGW